MIYKVEPPQDGEYAEVCDWTIRAVVCRLPENLMEEVTHHVVGLNRATGRGRVSTAIEAFDPATMTLSTRSGRHYHLVGQPGLHVFAEYVWQYWRALNQAVHERDVTADYWSGST
ncbi:hypothetical protein [Methylotuvimicrobium sp. KM2]|uniref:hypothetical protein n=1 Tax=Methylotuvimicrobium sp. KM2 TaxID=3133976 RepID=UPI0031018350